VKKTAEPQALHRFREELADLVQVATFQATASQPTWTGKWHIFQWTRDSGWKRDTLQVAWRTISWPECSLGADWAVPRGSTHLLASGINASYWRRRVSDSRVPTGILAVVSAARWRAALLEDVRAAIQWLETCSTKAGALADLHRPDRNGPGVGTDAYNYIETYIGEHAP
jgi:hypothetical protein